MTRYSTAGLPQGQIPSSARPTTAPHSAWRAASATAKTLAMPSVAFGAASSCAASSFGECADVGDLMSSHGASSGSDREGRAGIAGDAAGCAGRVRVLCGPAAFRSDLGRSHDQSCDRSGLGDPAGFLPHGVGPVQSTPLRITTPGVLGAALAAGRRLLQKSFVPALQAVACWQPGITRTVQRLTCAAWRAPVSRWPDTPPPWAFNWTVSGLSLSRSSYTSAEVR